MDNQVADTAPICRGQRHEALAVSLHVLGARDWPIRFTVVNMTRRSGSSARAQALAKAAQAVARRDAERIAREKAVQAALADFFHAQSEIQRIDAEACKAAAPFELVARDAVRALNRLGETRSGIAALTGLSLVRVRDYVQESIDSPGPTQAAPTRQAYALHDDKRPNGEVVSTAAESKLRPTPIPASVAKRHAARRKATARGHPNHRPRGEEFDKSAEMTSCNSRRPLSRVVSWPAGQDKLF